MRQAPLAASALSLVFLAGCGATLGQDGGLYRVSKASVSLIPNGSVVYLPAATGRLRASEGFSNSPGASRGRMSLREAVSERFATAVSTAMSTSRSLPADAKLEIAIEAFREDIRCREISTSIEMACREAGGPTETSFREIVILTETTWRLSRGAQSLTRTLTMRRVGLYRPAEQLSSMAAEAAERFFEDPAVRALLASAP